MRPIELVGNLQELKGKAEENGGQPVDELAEKRKTKQKR
jgi:hypothetical protein